MRREIIRLPVATEGPGYAAILLGLAGAAGFDHHRTMPHQRLPVRAPPSLGPLCLLTGVDERIRRAAGEADWLALRLPPVAPEPSGDGGAVTSQIRCPGRCLVALEIADQPGPGHVVGVPQIH